MNKSFATILLCMSLATPASFAAQKSKPSFFQRHKKALLITGSIIGAYTLYWAFSRRDTIKAYRMTDEEKLDELYTLRDEVDKQGKIIKTLAQKKGRPLELRAGDEYKTENDAINAYEASVMALEYKARLYTQTWGKIKSPIRGNIAESMHKGADEHGEFVVLSKDATERGRKEFRRSQGEQLNRQKLINQTVLSTFPKSKQAEAQGIIGDMERDLEERGAIDSTSKSRLRALTRDSVRD